MPIIILFVRKISRQEWIIVWPIILIKIIHIQKMHQSCCNSLWSLRILPWQWFRKKRHLVYFMVCYSKFRRITMDFVKIYHYTISFEMSELDIERSFEIFTVCLETWLTRTTHCTLMVMNSTPIALIVTSYERYNAFTFTRFRNWFKIVYQNCWRINNSINYKLRLCWIGIIRLINAND